ncbi:hypothetical protein [Lysobacter gummosus]
MREHVLHAALTSSRLRRGYHSGRFEEPRCFPVFRRSPGNC